MPGNSNKVLPTFCESAFFKSGLVFPWFCFHRFHHTAICGRAIYFSHCFSGSGIILTSDGYIVTCKHVVDGAETIKVILNDESEHEAKLVGSDSRSDLIGQIRPSTTIDENLSKLP